MLDQYVSREQQIADLTVHGWEPVRDAPSDPRSYVGVWSAELNCGYAIARSMAGMRFIELDIEMYSWLPAPAAWEDINSGLLDLIVKRLSGV